MPEINTGRTFGEYTNIAKKKEYSNDTANSENTTNVTGRDFGKYTTFVNSALNTASTSHNVINDLKGDALFCAAKTIDIPEDQCNEFMQNTIAKKNILTDTIKKSIKEEIATNFAGEFDEIKQLISEGKFDEAEYLKEALIEKIESYCNTCSYDNYSLNVKELFQSVFKTLVGKSSDEYISETKSQSSSEKGYEKGLFFGLKSLFKEDSILDKELLQEIGTDKNIDTNEYNKGLAKGGAITGATLAGGGIAAFATPVVSSALAAGIPIESVLSAGAVCNSGIGLIAATVTGGLFSYLLHKKEA